MLRDQLAPAHLELLDSVTRAPTGPLRVAAAESALAELRRSGSFAAEALGRMDLVEALHYVPDDPSTLTHLAWLRQAVHRPELEDDDEERLRLHWMLKWAPHLMLALPQVSLDEVEDGLDDLEQVYRRSGFALRPVLGFRARVAQERGDDERLRSVMAQWSVEPRDQLSDCLACDTAAQGMAWERLDPARAASAWQPLFDGRQHCTEEPQRGLAHDALLRLDAGQPDDAVAQLGAAWRDARSDSLNNEAVAYCLLAWTRMGNVDRALPALLDRLDWLAEISVLSEKMTWTTVATAVLDASAAAGLAPDLVGGRARADVREEWQRTAAAIAHDFDARNGTTYYADRLADWLDLDQVSATPHLPPTRIRPTGQEAPPRPASIAAHAEALAADVETFGAGFPAMVAAWLHHRDTLLESAGPADEEHVALLDRSAAAQADEPGPLLDRAEQAARATGDDATLLRVEAERVAVLGAEDGDQVTRLTSIAEQLARDTHHRDAAAVWRTAARLATSPEQAEDLFVSGATASREAGDTGREGLALMEAARAASGSPDHAADLLARARPLVEPHPPLRLMADDTEARLLASVGRLDDAVDVLRRSLDEHHSPVIATPTRLLLCDLLTDADRLDDLLPASEKVLADAVDLQDPLVLALGQRFQGLALVHAGRPAEALELLDAALPVIGERLPDLLGPLRWAHAQALTLLGESGPARTSYAAASAAFEAAGRRHEASHAQLQAGNRAWDVDDLEAAEAHFDAAIGFAAEEHDPVVLAEAGRTRAIVRSQAGADDDLAELDAVPDDVRRQMAGWGVDEPVPGFSLAVLDAQVLRNGANLLAAGGRFEEAAIRMRSAAAAWPDEEEKPLLLAERGLFVAGAGRYADAEALIREGLDRLDDEHWGSAKHQVVMRWVSMLDEVGRSQDADRIWQELGR